MEKEVKKRILKKYIFISFLLIAISVSILLMVKYNVEGEKNEIMTLVNNHDKLPSFINSSYTSEFGKELTLVDYNNVLSNYDISGDIAYTVNGNTININIFYN